MSDQYIAAQEAISEARAHLWAAVKIDAGRRAMEGDIESANSRLEDALDWLRRGDVVEARGEVAEALGFLRTDTSRLIIAEDTAALDDAIRVLEGISWD